MKVFFLLLLLPMLLFWACDSAPWPKEDREVFIESCVSGANDSLRAEINVEEYCSCVQQKLEAKYSVNDIMEQDFKVNEYLEMQRECLEEQHHKKPHKD